MKKYVINYLYVSKQVTVTTHTQCQICKNSFVHQDITLCPINGKLICPLCCSLDVHCGDKCHSDTAISKKIHNLFSRHISVDTLKILTMPVVQFIAMTVSMSFISIGILFLIYLQIPVENKPLFTGPLLTIFLSSFIIIGIINWLFILVRNGNQATLKKLRSQTQALAKEIKAHQQTSSALHIAKTAAESANEAKSRYLANLSHELRTPLNVLLGYAQLLMRDQELQPKQRDSIAIIRRNGDHLTDLIESLLEVSKIEAGRMTLQRDEFNLKSVLQQLVEMFQMQASKKGIKFHYHCSANLPEYVTTDKQRFRQILINLISNAIKYTEEGSVTFTITYRSEVATFSIVDTGVGIAKSDQAIIFKPFEQIRNAHTQSIGGTGLGLTISQSLAELMGGEVSLTSQLGKGSTFNFRLMLFKHHKGPKEPELTQSQPIAYDGEPKTILVVDDDINQRELMFNLLTPIGFNVLLAEDASQGFLSLQDNDIDLILMDVQMPKMNGWQMVKSLRKQFYQMPVLMISANARDAEYNLQAEGYHNGYIAKPVDLDVLLEKISQQLKIRWQYKNTDKCSAKTISAKNKPEANREHYLALISLAEIGYLSGFKDKFAEIESEYYYPEDSASQIQEYVEVCNFPKIIEYLNELINEPIEK